MQRLSVAVAIVLAAAVSWFGFFFFRDNFSTHFPVKTLSAAAFRGGEIPWWNFHDGGGQPLAGNPNTLTFYPDNVLYLILPAHVAFNLHFLVHLGVGFWCMRALIARVLAPRSDGVAGAPLTRPSATLSPPSGERGGREAHRRHEQSGDWSPTFGAAFYVLSGVVISATAFYNLIVAVACIPLALLAVERRSWRMLGVAFGLMLLAAEPVTLIGATLSVGIVAWRRMTVKELAIAVVIAAAIGAPQLIAFSEIAGEVERAAGSSARTVLTTSLGATRVAEIFVWPFTGFLNDAGGPRGKLFSTLFLGIIALPALFQRSRYVVVALAMFFLALGVHNPLVRLAVEQFDALRIMRFPEKFALPLVVALVVLAARFFARARFKAAWVAITFLPLLWTTYRALPIDWYEPYRVAPVAPRRVHVPSTIAAGSFPAREEYRLRAQNHEPLFGALAGLRYVINRSPDRMHSLLSRIVEERFHAAPERYLRLDDAAVVPRAVAARNVDEAVQLFEHGFDVAPRALSGTNGTDGTDARVLSYRERGQTIDINVSGPALLLVNQSYFASWVARMGDRELETVPVNIDRLGVVVPASGRVTLTFGRHRAATVSAWLLSLLLLVALPVVEKLDRRAGEVERAADEE